MKVRVFFMTLVMAMLAGTAQAGSIGDCQKANTKRGFPALHGSVLANRLNLDLAYALDSIGCVVTCANGVAAVSKDHQKANPSSCHDIGMAVDIGSLKCKNDLSNEANLQRLYNALPSSVFSLKCYKKQGRCKVAHPNHVHWGAAQWNGCW